MVSQTNTSDPQIFASDRSTNNICFSVAEFNKIYKISPVRNVYQLDMTWALPPLMDKYREKPLSYLSWIIGHEGEELALKASIKGSNVWGTS